MTGPIRSWDDYVDALGEMPDWAQYAAQQRIRNLINTDLQLQRFGVSYPHSEPENSKSTLGD
jgi:hypothetical protein